MNPAARVESEMRQRFDVAPNVVMRSPGRVNLIGEHTDYSLLPVMPFAIDRAIYVAVGEGPPGITADSLNHPGEIAFELNADRTQMQGWHRYVAAAVDAVGFVGGARILIDADLPGTGGLSSSSALTVGVIMALGTYLGDPPTRGELPALALAAERSIGVESGAMDQTVIALAKEGHCLRIDFDPLATRDVPVPPELAMVVAYSGTEASKAETARHAYNSRVVASRIAALLLASTEGVVVSDRPVLAEVHASQRAGELPETTTAESAAQRVGIDVAQIVELTADRFDADEPVPVRAVATHVLAEAARVDQAEVALVAGDFSSLGTILDDSHQSLRNFGASTPALDRVVGAMSEAGAFGARLTGAGFGGYAVAICDPSAVDRVIDAAERATGGPAFRVEPSNGVSGV